MKHQISPIWLLANMLPDEMREAEERLEANLESETAKALDAMGEALEALKEEEKDHTSCAVWDVISTSNELARAQGIRIGINLMLEAMGKQGDLKGDA